MPKRVGSALVDVITVVLIVGILVAITVPMLMTARQRSARFKCTDRLREIGEGLRRYAADNGGRFPATRPSHGEVVIADVSDSGRAASDPFGPDGPAPNNVPAAFFLLVRGGYISADSVICPNTTDVPDTFEGGVARLRSNFSDPERNLSYSIQNPYASDSAIAAGFRWDEKLPADFVLAADKNPGLIPGAATRPTTASTQHLKAMNSTNHDRWGQNVLYADGRIEFATTPFVGIDQDNIYLTKAYTLLDSPRDKFDTVLLPAGKNP